jgi:hypothetical protein
MISTYLGGSPTSTETGVVMNEDDNHNHFMWCWNKNIENFKKEEIPFNNEGEHLDYIYSLFNEVFYTQQREDIRNSINDFFGDLFNREKPFEKPIPFRNDYAAIKTVTKPIAYVVPQAWSRVVERLLLNRVDGFRILSDTVIRMPVLYIRSQETGKTPYEGHFVHSNVRTESDTQFIQLFAGDYYFPCNQSANRYIIETLEPEATDAFLAWGFFDAIFQQKEWFSDYLFEETALRLLEQDQRLKSEYDSLKTADKEFMSDPWKMMAWIYRRSPWYEPSHLRYPVYRIEEAWPTNRMTPVDYSGMNPHRKSK